MTFFEICTEAYIFKKTYHLQKFIFSWLFWTKLNSLELYDFIIQTHIIGLSKIELIESSWFTKKVASENIRYAQHFFVIFSPLLEILRRMVRKSIISVPHRKLKFSEENFFEWMILFGSYNPCPINMNWKYSLVLWEQTWWGIMVTIHSKFERIEYFPIFRNYIACMHLI